MSTLEKTGANGAAPDNPHTVASLASVQLDIGEVMTRHITSGTDPELVSLAVITEAFRTLGPNATRRTLRWALERYGTKKDGPA